MAQYKLKAFNREAKKENVFDRQLIETIDWFGQLDEKEKIDFRLVPI